MELLIKEGMQARETVAVPSGKQVFSIGRSSDNDLVITDKMASRQHARILFQGNQATLEDNHSANGVNLNGIRISTPVILKNGDEIGIGSTIIEVKGLETEPEPEDLSTQNIEPVTRPAQPQPATYVIRGSNAAVLDRPAPPVYTPIPNYNQGPPAPATGYEPAVQPVVISAPGAATPPGNLKYTPQNYTPPSPQGGFNQPPYGTPPQVTPGYQPQYNPPPPPLPSKKTWLWIGAGAVGLLVVVVVVLLVLVLVNNNKNPQQEQISNLSTAVATFVPAAPATPTKSSPLQPAATTAPATTAVPNPPTATAVPTKAATPTKVATPTKAATTTAATTPGTSSQASTLNKEGNDLYSQGKYDQALTKYQAAIAADPNNPLYHSNAAWALINLNKGPEALKEFKKASDLAPDDTSYLTDLGYGYWYNNQLDEGEKVLLDVIQKDSSIARAHYFLGFIYYDRKDYEKALDKYLKAIELKPGVANYYVELGKTYYQLDRNQEASDAFNKALEIDPESVYAYNGLGNVAYSQGNYEESVKHYQKAIELKPSDSVLHSNLAGAYLKLGDKDKARVEAKKALDLNPNNTRAKEVLQETGE